MKPSLLPQSSSSSNFLPSAPQYFCNNGSTSALSATLSVHRHSLHFFDSLSSPHPHPHSLPDFESSALLHHIVLSHSSLPSLLASSSSTGRHNEGFFTPATNRYTPASTSSCFFSCSYLISRTHSAQASSAASCSPKTTCLRPPPSSPRHSRMQLLLLPVLLCLYSFRKLLVTLCGCCNNSACDCCIMHDLRHYQQRPWRGKGKECSYTLFAEKNPEHCSCHTKKAHLSKFSRPKKKSRTVFL